MVNSTNRTLIRGLSTKRRQKETLEVNCLIFFRSCKTTVTKKSPAMVVTPILETTCLLARSAVARTASPFPASTTSRCTRVRNPKTTTPRQRKNSSPLSKSRVRVKSKSFMSAKGTTIVNQHQLLATQDSLEERGHSPQSPFLLTFQNHQIIKRLRTLRLHPQCPGVPLTLSSQSSYLKPSLEQVLGTQPRQPSRPQINRWLIQTSTNRIRSNRAIKEARLVTAPGLTGDHHREGGELDYSISRMCFHIQYQYLKCT